MLAEQGAELVVGRAGNVLHRLVVVGRLVDGDFPFDPVVGFPI